MLSKRVLNGNGRSITISVDFIVATLATIVLALGGWGLLRVAQMNDCFATITQVEKVEASVEKVKSDCGDNYSKVENKIEERMNVFDTKLDNKFTIIENKITGVEGLLKGHIYGSKENPTKR